MERGNNKGDIGSMCGAGIRIIMHEDIARLDCFAAFGQQAARIRGCSRVSGRIAAACSAWPRPIGGSANRSARRQNPPIPRMMLE